MSLFLSGVPGKIKTLMDRLTSTRAGYLDRLDAAITTVYNTANWTGTKAGYIDAAISTAGAKVQTGLYTFSENSSGNLNITSTSIATEPGDYILSGALTGGSYATALNISSAGGYLYFLAMGVVDTTARTITTKVTIDGTAALEKGCAHTGTANVGNILVDLMPIRFNTSCKVEIKSNLSETDKVFIKVAYSLD